MVSCSPKMPTLIKKKLVMVLFSYQPIIKTSHAQFLVLLFAREYKYLLYYIV